MAKLILTKDTFKYVRIPNTDKLYPKNYKLSIDADLKGSTFAGKVDIEVESKDVNLDCIFLNYLDIEIHDGHFTFKDDSVAKLTTVTYSPSEELVKLSFDSKRLGAGGIVSLEFTGVLNDLMKGLYRTSMKDFDGNQVFAATTQFEATDARRAFPCFDEPKLKATFDVTLSYPNLRGYVALSNMPVISEHEENGKMIVSFDRSPIMSTYLLAVIIGPFEYIEAYDYKNRPVRVYTGPGKKSLGNFSLTTAVKALEIFEKYFDVEFPLPKMDLIAIPDFAMGAMENWGLVTYREIALLVDEKETSSILKQRICLTVVHELAHQWFGNLVTMEWWTHLWLNEGFATFMEYVVADKIYPEFDVWSQFLTETYTSALSLDALSNSHPIEVPVSHPAEIDEIFDLISYEKGCSIIRMLHTFIGDDNFRKGMKQYLNHFSYKNAVTEDLWYHLSQSSGKPINKLMSDWTSKMGYPRLILEYKKISSEDYSLKISQTKFSMDSARSEQLWMVPITIISGKDPNKIILETILEKKEETYTLTGVSDDWIKLNPGSIFFYRTQYPQEIMSKMYPAIQRKAMPDTDRYGILNDYLAFCEAGSIQSSDLLRLIQIYKFEDSYIIWSLLDSCLSQLKAVFVKTEFEKDLNLFILDLYSNISEQLGWEAKESEPHTSTLLRQIVINRLISCNDINATNQAKVLYRSFIDEGKRIDSNLRGAVYAAIVKHGSDEEFENLFDIYTREDNPEEQRRISRALGLAEDLARVEKSYKFNMSDKVRSQDKPFYFIFLGKTNIDYAFERFKNDKDVLLKTYKYGANLNRIIGACIESFISEEKASEVESYFNSNKIEGSDRKIKQAIESIRINARWRERDSECVKSFFASR